jgi:hypothetical protein
MKRITLFISLLFFPSLLMGDCESFTNLFTESFSDTLYKDPSSSVDHWGEGYVTMRFLGAVFDIETPAYFPSWINSATAGDFDEDGWVDFIGTSSSFLDVAFVRNLGVNDSVGYFGIDHYIYGGDEDNNGWPDHPTSGHVTVTSGDYNGDGHLDVFLVKAEGGGDIMYVWLFMGAGNGYFQQIDVTSTYASALGGYRWSATSMKSWDMDEDGDVDIIFGNRYGRVLFLQNDGDANFTVHTIIETPWGDRGVSAVALIDYDMDGDKDIITGSVSYPLLFLYRNDGLGNFEIVDTLGDQDGNYDFSDDEYDGAATVLIVADFDGDGDEDFVVGTDNWNWPFSGPGRRRIGGKAFLYRNNGDGTFTGDLVYNRGCGTPQGCDFVYDFDLGDVLDFDNDGDIDFFIADGNHSQRYYLFVNSTADVYNLTGRAISLRISNLSPDRYAVVSVRINELDDYQPNDTWIEYYVTNDGGTHWERLTDEELRGEVEHSFHHYGSDFRWKANLYAEDDNPPDIGSGSYETPRIDEIGFVYRYVGVGKYSRTSQVVAIMDTDGDSISEEYLYSSYFQFPGFRGYLTAWNVTNLTLDTTSTSLQIIGGNIGAEFLWDAGELLENRSYSDRTVYTAVPSGNSFERVLFNVNNREEFEEYLMVSESEVVDLIEFVLGRYRDFKLLDINHSTPVFVGPPDGSPPLYSDPAYESFKQTHRNRTKVIYVGSNDGMLHAFNAVTGEELWGFIPYNLLPKLKRMMRRDSLTGDLYYDFEEHPEFVDGSPVVKDVKFSDDSWHTILITGQGPGKGKNDKNYYICFDVTDPENPQYLWEFTHRQGNRYTTGETWSKPEIYRVRIGNSERWVAFVGSGYDNDGDPNNYEGNVFYVIDVEDGSLVASFEVPDEHPEDFDIPNAIPGSPTVVDYDDDGFADFVYFGDLEGRIWRLDVRSNHVNDWELGDPRYQDPEYSPIITKPGVEKRGGVIYVYFGTGGDDRAPSSREYGFYALRDYPEENPQVVWYYGPEDYEDMDNFGPNSHIASLENGDKVWADPVVYDHVVYFATLKGSIESVNPCENLSGGASKLYAVLTSTGETILRDANGDPIAYLETAQKVRSAVTVGGRVGERRKIYVQNFANPENQSESPTQQVLTVPVMGWRLIIRAWREIY